MTRTPILNAGDEGPMLFGVCAWLAERTGLGARWLRLGFVVAAAASGIGLVAYAALAIALPSPGEVGLPWGVRLRERAARLWAGAVGVGARAAAILLRWRDARASDDPASSFRALVGGAALLLGGLLLLDSFRLLDWLDGARAVALILLLIGVGLLRGGR